MAVDSYDPERARAVEAEVGQPRTIMVIEQDIDNAELYRMLLADAGHSSVLFHEPRSALAAFQECPTKYDGVILNQRQMGITGVETLQQMREVSPIAANLHTAWRLTEAEQAALNECGQGSLTVVGMIPYDIDEIIDFAARVDAFWQAYVPPTARLSTDPAV